MKGILKAGFYSAIGLFLIALFAFAFWPRPVEVDVVEAAMSPMLVTVDEDGTTRIRERYIVSSPLSGRLRRILLDPGDPVFAESTLLAQLEPTDPVLLDAREIAEAQGRVKAAEASVRRAEADFERARAEYDFTENDLMRVKTAFASDAATEAEVDFARSKFQQASAAFRVAQFNVDIASHELEVAQSALLITQGVETDEESLARLSIYSPIDGVVLHVLQENVAVVSPGTPLIEVGDLSDLELVIDVLSTDAVSIEPGQRVIVERWGGGRPLEATVRLVEPSAFLKISALGIEEQRVNVIADLITPPEERAALGDNFRIEARIVTWSSDSALLVPTSALFRHNDAWAVFTLENGKVERREISVGRMNGRFAQVNTGISDGDFVIVHPSDELTVGLKAMPRE